MKRGVCVKWVPVLILGCGASAAWATTMADYHADFSGTPGAGWSYLWNEAGDIADPANYAPLVYNGSGVWNDDGGATLPRAEPGGYVSLTATGGHPGRGSTQSGGVGNSIDRYAIAAYTIQPGEAGPLWLNNATLKKLSTSGNEDDVRVLVNNATVYTASATPGNSVSFNRYLGNLNVGDTVYVAFGPHGNDTSDTFQSQFQIVTPDAATGPLPITSYRASFQNTTPAAGWRYLWNSGGAIGDAAHYSDLHWDNGRYDGVVNGTYPDPDPAGYVTLNSTGGHPGRGFTQTGAGNSVNRYAISAYTVSYDGWYWLTDTLIGDSDGKGDNDVVVYVNDQLIWSQSYTGSANRFDTALGQLHAGDVIYVGVGPGASGQDYNDNFAMDYTIAFDTVPEPGAAVCGLIAAAGLLWGRRNRTRR